MAAQNQMVDATIPCAEMPMTPSDSTVGARSAEPDVPQPSEASAFGDGGLDLSVRSDSQRLRYDLETELVELKMQVVKEQRALDEVRAARDVLEDARIHARREVEAAQNELLETREEWKAQRERLPESVLESLESRESNLKERERILKESEATILALKENLQRKGQLLRARRKRCLEIERRESDIARAEKRIARGRTLMRRIRELEAANEELGRASRRFRRSESSRNLWRASDALRWPKTIKRRRDAGELVVDAGKWRKSSPLTAMGYHVGQTEGLTASEREDVLQRIVEARILFPERVSAAERQAWGTPRSVERLAKVVGHLTWNLRFHGRRLGSRSRAVKQWRSDLRWLKGHYRPLWKRGRHGG